MEQFKLLRRIFQPEYKEDKSQYCLAGSPLTALSAEFYNICFIEQTQAVFSESSQPTKLKF